MDGIEFRVGLINGRVGYGETAWLALLAACANERKADIIAANIKRINSQGEIIALNNVTIGYQEKRLIPV